MQMNYQISIKEYKNLHPEQWVQVYGVISNCYKYINTCQAYQIQTILEILSCGWFEDIFLYPVDEEEGSLAIGEFIKTGGRVRSIR
jgi:hypothetical protein